MLPVAAGWCRIVVVDIMIQATLSAAFPNSYAQVYNHFIDFVSEPVTYNSPPSARSFSGYRPYMMIAFLVTLAKRFAKQCVCCVYTVQCVL